MNYISKYKSPVGNLTIASDGEGIIGLWLEGQKYYASTLGDDFFEGNDLEVFHKTKEWLDKYFVGQDPRITLFLDLKGSEFRKKIWEILLDIPYGKLTTYSEVAKTYEEITGKKTSPRAVGGAVGHNPISIIIPCHRVVGAKGSLTGYAGGIDKKTWLLQHEKAILI
ncbi:MAG: methylated-DNA--[protein]-cysteine S-methyltransferase [Defluviitaleaceae bacterium]|nr:methylated-DNA--[protein]-cysteine S-methyltransferase [Defluviitaleaceae bacterium]